MAALDIKAIIKASDEHQKVRRATLPEYLWYDPCMCDSVAEHEEGQALQAKYRHLVPKDECVGCYLGDAGPSAHDFGSGCEHYA